MLMRFDPIRELDRLGQQMWQDFGSGTPSMMPVDVLHHGDHFVAHFDLPGVDPGSIEVTVERNVLSVSARRTSRAADGDTVIVAERPRGEFRRQLYLSDELDTERVDASYDSGVLTVTIPVNEHAKPRRIEVTSSSKGDQRVLTEH